MNPDESDGPTSAEEAHVAELMGPVAVPRDLKAVPLKKTRGRFLDKKPILPEKPEVASPPVEAAAEPADNSTAKESNVEKVAVKPTPEQAVLPELPEDLKPKPQPPEPPKGKPVVMRLYVVDRLVSIIFKIVRSRPSVVLFILLIVLTVLVGLGWFLLR